MSALFVMSSLFVTPVIVPVGESFGLRLASFYRIGRAISQVRDDADWHESPLFAANRKLIEAGGERREVCFSNVTNGKRFLLPAVLLPVNLLSGK